MTSRHFWEAENDSAVTKQEQKQKRSRVDNHPPNEYRSPPAPLNAQCALDQQDSLVLSSSGVKLLDSSLAAGLGL